LPTRGVSEWAEVWPIARRVARLLGYCTAWIPSHIATVRKTVYPGVEGVGVIHILEYLSSGIFIESASITDYLGYLPPGYLIIRTECPI
jgi:hypothetical protein